MGRERVASSRKEERDCCGGGDDERRRDNVYGQSAEEGGRDDGDDDFVIDNADVLAYLGTLSPSEAVQVATDCLVNGIIVGSGRSRRRRRDAMIAEDGDGKAKSILRAWIEKKGSDSDHSVVNEPTLCGYFY
jgi:hypothetical protein